MAIFQGVILTNQNLWADWWKRPFLYMHLIWQLWRSAASSLSEILSWSFLSYYCNIIVNSHHQVSMLQVKYKLSYMSLIWSFSRILNFVVWETKIILWVYIFVVVILLKFSNSFMVDKKRVHGIHENLNPTEITTNANPLH